MARETKAERQLREAAEQRQREEEQQATYPQRLMETMQRAQAVNFELVANADCTFMLYDRDAGGYGRYQVDLFYTVDAENALSELNWEVQHKEDRVREAQQRELLRTNALAKLTQAEREVLGL